MNAGQSREVDLDLLAEYVGGALRGTRDEAAVEGLIAADPAWSRAHEAMTEAVDAVRADLAEWGRTPETMPAAIADRIATALTHGDPGQSARGAPARLPELAQRRRPGPPDRDAAGGAGAARRARSRPGAGGRRPRWVPIAVAAAVAAFAGFGASELLGVTRTDGGSTAAYPAASGAGENAALSSGPPRALTEPSAERLLASGTDYHPATLPETIAGRAQALPMGKTETEAAPLAADRAAGPAAPGLSRLTDRAALSACLDAVAAAHARGPVAVELVDYASFEGSPALVLVFLDGGGGRWAWVVGPDCGRAESGADTRYRTSVG